MIGIFDSGLGGLTVLQSIAHKLPAYSYVYLGDNARAPYGNKSQEIIYQYTKEAVDFLFNQGCCIIIIACNTASSKALRKIQQEYLPKKYPDRRVLGVIKPLVEETARIKRTGPIGVIGTKATIDSDVYKKELDLLVADMNIIQKSAPLLVPLIEEGWLKRPETKMILKKYLRPFKQKQVRILIPACTHYPFLLSDMQRIMTNKCQVLDPGQIIATSFADYLNRHPDINSRCLLKKSITFFTTDDPEKFKKIGGKFLQADIKAVQKIKL